jgi:hypothetical protein
MATDGAVTLDPVKEDALNDHALLRKASDQQNAEWRERVPPSHTGRHKGASSFDDTSSSQTAADMKHGAQAQLAKLFGCVAEGKPIALPPPPPEALWQSAVEARRQLVAEAPPVVKRRRSVSKHRKGATCGRVHGLCSLLSRCSAAAFARTQAFGMLPPLTNQGPSLWPSFGFGLAMGPPAPCVAPPQRAVQWI